MFDFDNILKYFGGGDKDKGWQGIIGAALGLGAGYDSYKEAKKAQDEGRSRPTSGYQGGIPEYTAYRKQVPLTDTTRRPGSSGQRYFTDMEYVATPAYEYPVIPEQGENETDEVYSQKISDLTTAAYNTQQANLASLLGDAQTRATAQQTELETSNKNNPFRGTATPPNYTPVINQNVAATPKFTASNDIYDVLNRLVESSKATPYGTTTTVSDTENVVKAAEGGIMGMYLGGPTDGMADQIPARISGRQEARLSDGEYVVPADVVSHLGNGNSDAGAKVLKDMMARVRTARTGSPQQGKEINPNKLLPR